MIIAPPSPPVAPQRVGGRTDRGDPCSGLGKALRVLLVEDSPTAARRISGLLADCPSGLLVCETVQTLAEALVLAGTTGSACPAAEAAPEAEAQLSRAGFDAVVLDLSLPDSEGVATCARLHAAAPDLPIVVLTETDDESLALEAMHAGAQDYLVKGGSDSLLLRRSVRYAVERSRAAALRRRSDEQLRLLTEQLPAIAWTTDADLRITSSVGSGLSALGLVPGETVGLTLQEYLGTSDPLFPPLAAHHAALAGESASLLFRWKEQSLHIHVEPLKSPRGTIAGTIGVALNITDQKRLQESIDAARVIQQRLFPAGPPALPGFDIAGTVFPAEETAGDYYDFVPMPDGACGLVVGDVSGHGLGAALLMAELRAYLRPLAAARGETTESDPGAILTQVNQRLSADLESSSPCSSHFVTLFLARLDPARRAITWAGAGHCAYLLPKAGGHREAVRLDSTGFPLGMPGASGTVGTLGPQRLAPGDLLLIVTDGFQEARDGGGEVFSRNRMLATVAEHRSLPAAELIRRLFEEVRLFSSPQPQRDDMTAIVVRVLEESPFASANGRPFGERP